MSLLFKPTGFNKSEFLQWIDIKYESKTKTKLWKRALIGYNTKTMWDAKDYLQNLFMEKYEQMFIDYGRDWTAITWPYSEAQLNHWRYLRVSTDKKTDRNNRLKMLYAGGDEVIDKRFKNNWIILKCEDVDTSEIIFDIDSPLNQQTGEASQSMNLQSVNAAMNANQDIDTASTIFAEDLFERLS